MAKSEGDFTEDFTARAEQYLESVFDAVKCKVDSVTYDLEIGGRSRSIIMVKGFGY